jgi:hypothetical protein
MWMGPPRPLPGLDVGTIFWIEKLQASPDCVELIMTEPLASIRCGSPFETSQHCGELLGSTSDL